MSSHLTVAESSCILNHIFVDEVTLLAYIRKLKETLVPRGDITERTVKSGIWSALMNFVTRGIQLGKVVILARLLAPSDFGLLGIAVLTLAVLQTFTELGIDTALIQRIEQNVDEFLDTAWTMKLIRGTTIAVIGILAAPYASALFGEPRATFIIQIMALTMVLSSLKNPGVMYLKKNLEFHRQFVLSLSGTVANAIVTIGLALVYRNVWSLVAGYIVGNLVTLLVSYFVHEYRPRPRFDVKKARELFGYGKWLTASTVVVFLLDQGDDGFVGWLLGASALGFYQMAYRFSNAPATEVSQVITSVVFPAYSQIQGNQKQLREGFFRTLQLSTTVAFPMATGIALVAPSFVALFFGEQWLEMVVPMQILALWGAVRSIDWNIGPLFNAIGRPDYFPKIQAFKIVLIAFFIFPATSRWGTVGTAAVIACVSLVTNPVGDYIAVKAVNGSFRRFFTTLLYPLAGSLVMVLGILLIKTTVGEQPPALQFFLLTGTGIILYPVAMWAIDRRYEIGVESMVRNILGAIR